METKTFYGCESCYNYIKVLEQENKGKRGRSLKRSWTINYFPKVEVYAVEIWWSEKHYHNTCIF